MEIGSEFWLYDLPSEFDNSIPKWISKFGKAVLTSSGRGAISLLLKNENIKVKTALLPSYICNSVIQPFINNGYSCVFYDVKEDLTPDLESIDRYNDIGVFLHMGYFGFPTNNGLSEIIKRFKKQSTIIVEDITHSLFSDYESFEENDYYIASIRKWTGLPSGGFLASKNKAINCDIEKDEVFADIRKEALLIKGNYIKNQDRVLKNKYLDLFSKAEDYLDNDLNIHSIDKVSKTIINNLNVEELKKARAANFNILSDELSNTELIRPVFDKSPKNIVPLFFPIYIEKKRSEIRQILNENNIYCPIHWPREQHIGSDYYKFSNIIYDLIISIPCDQRYKEVDMKRISSLIKKTMD